MELPVQLDTYNRPEQQARVAWLKEHAVGTILDVGCSWGYVLSAVSGQAGVDINPHLVRLASLLSPHRLFAQADARNLPFKDGEFDTVIVAETLEHLPWSIGVAKAVSEAQRVARKRVLVTVPAHDGREAESFKHCWLVGPDETALLRTMLGPDVSVVEFSGFVCFEARLG